ncbi:MAG: ImcF-related family protein [Coxiellaceae bacterium]|nr:ImcF-related family protein [Coxiellaceae bacterium]
MKKTSNKSLRLALILFLVLLLTLFGVYWFIGYRKTHQLDVRLQHLSQSLSEKTHWRSRLKAEQDLLNLINTSHVRQYRWLGMGQVDNVYQRIEQQYHTDLNQHFIPYLKQLTISQLTKQSTRNPTALYNACKAYVMATQTGHQDTKFQRSWYQQFIPQQFVQALDQALQQQKITWSPQAHLLARTRSKFQNLSPAEISFIVIQSYYPNALVPIDFNLDLPKSIQTDNLAVPELYSSALFFNVYQKQIPAMAPQAAHGDWVTGSIQPTWDTQHSPLKLIKQVQGEYLQQFQLHWQSLLQHVRLKPTPYLSDLSQLIHDLQQPNSHLWLLITTINNNATLHRGEPTPMSNFLAKNRGYQGFQAALYTLQQQVDAIRNNKDPLAASFTFTAARMNQSHTQDDLELSFAVAKQLPRPINQWLETIDGRFWHMSLAKSKQYIQQQWQKNIMHTYNATIAQRYPVFSYAKPVIAIKQFEHFFAPRGVLDGFVQHYLNPYIDINSHHWQMKTMDGEQLALSKNHLDMLTRAALIRKMFFQPGSHHASAQFFLNTPHLSPHTQRAILNIAGQMYTVTHKHLYNQQFSWPGPSPGFVTIQLTNDLGKSTTKTYTGPWAWFQALDHTRMRTTDQLNQYQVTVQLGKQSAQYMLTTQDIINPFIPHVLAQFRCPERI